MPPNAYMALACTPYQVGEVYVAELLMRTVVSSPSMSPGCAPVAPVSHELPVSGPTNR